MCTISPRPNRRGRGAPGVCNIRKKSPYFRTGSSLNMAVRGGIDSLRSPCGQPAHCVHGLSNWLSPVVEPRSGLLIPPVCAIYEKKSPYFRTSSSLNMAVRGGLTRFARPAGSPLTAFTVCPTGCRQLSNPGRGFSSPRCVQYTKKKPVLSYELFFKYGGEGGIRTPDTLPYTHFPGVLLQPLGHLTKLSFLSCWNGR